MRFCVCLAIVFILLALGQKNANADFLLQFSTDGSVNHFESALGATTNVDIFVAQNSGSTYLTDFGLISIGFSVNYDPSKIELVGASPLAFSASFPRNQDLQINSGLLLVYGESQFNSGGANPGPVAVKGSVIKLGTLSLRTITSGTHNVSLRDYDPASPDFADFGLGGAGSSINFDQQLFGVNSQGSFQFSVGSITAVPEPSSVVLLVSTVLGLCGYRARRREARPATPR